MVCGFSDSDSSRYSPKIIALSHWICCYGHRFVFVIKCVFLGANTQDNPRGLSKHLAATAAVAVKRMLRANKFIIDRANVRCISFIPQQQQQPSATRAAENKNKKQETRWTEILTRIINKILFQNHWGGGGGAAVKPRRGLTVVSHEEELFFPKVRAIEEVLHKDHNQQSVPTIIIPLFSRTQLHLKEDVSGAQH